VYLCLGGYRVPVVAPAALFVLASTACAKLPAPPDPDKGQPIALVPFPGGGAIPRDWGRLVTVSPERTRSAFHLWFQNDSGTVHLVTFSSVTNRFSANVGVIPRQ
jgi:hypothetical protein